MRMLQSFICWKAFQHKLIKSRNLLRVLSLILWFASYVDYSFEVVMIIRLQLSTSDIQANVLMELFRCKVSSGMQQADWLKYWYS
jgi:hypothetical protein